MKTIALSVIFLMLFYNLWAQTSTRNITGLWYSSDSSRVYKIETTDSKDYEAELYSSKRKGDKAGFKILKNVKYLPAKDEYEGVIFSTIDNTATLAKLRMDENGKTLKLKLHRMIFMPVNIEWHREE